MSISVAGKLLLASTLVLVMRSAGAEPTPLVREFMSTPVSLFSFGLYRLGVSASTELSGIGGVTQVSYNLEKNRIRLTYFDTKFRCQGLDRKACEPLCEGFYKQLRELVCIGKDCEYNFFPTYFGHVGYNEANFYNQQSDERVAERLKDIAEVYVSLGADAPGYKRLVCEGPIAREKPSFRIEN
jgi:hypothetical protein